MSFRVAQGLDLGEQGDGVLLALGGAHLDRDVRRGVLDLIELLDERPCGPPSRRPGMPLRSAGARARGVEDDLAADRIEMRPEPPLITAGRSSSTVTDVSSVWR